MTSPSGMPTRIAIAPSAAPPALTTPSTPRGVRPTALKIAKSRARSRVTSSSVARRLTRPTATSRRLEPSRIGRTSARSPRTSSSGSSAAVPAAASRRRAAAAGSTPGAKFAITALGVERARERRGGEDQDAAVVVGFDVAADERERDGLAGDAHGDAVADGEAERVVEAAAGDRLAGAGEHAAVGDGVGEGREAVADGAGVQLAARAGDLEAGDRGGAGDVGSCWAAASADGSSRRTSHGFARRAGSSMTRWKVASTDSAATSVTTMNVSAATVSVARERLVNASLTPRRATVGRCSAAATRAAREAWPLPAPRPSASASIVFTRPARRAGRR